MTCWARCGHLMMGEYPHPMSARRLVKSAKGLGAKIFEGTGVTGISDGER